MPTITITIQVPEGAGTVSVDVDEGIGSQGSNGVGDRSATANPSALMMIENNAPPREARHQYEVLERVAERFGITSSPPATGSRPYLNFHPAQRYGSARVGALNVRSSRFYVACELSHVADVPAAEPAEGKYLTVYLRSAEDVDAALQLMHFAMRERGWEEHI